MTPVLTAPGARVLGALVEKQLTTPQQYPLSLAALVSACNQTTNREPVVNYDDDTVMAAVDGLKQLGLARSVLPSHGRSVVRFRHVLDEALGIDAPECALIGVLLLRGPQTIGELRIRTDRMASFDSLTELENELTRLAIREDPLVVNVGRRPGQKEERWATTLVPSFSDSHAVRSDTEPASAAGAPSDPETGHGASGSSELAALQAMVIELRDEVAELRASLAELRASLGD